MALNPVHFAGAEIPSTVARVPCGEPWRQHAYQSLDRTSREDIGAAIAEAEDQLETQLGFRLAPAWEIDEWRLTARPYDPELVMLNGRDVRGYGQATEARWKLWISGGVRNATLLDGNAAIMWNDSDGDGIADQALVSAATSADACEIQCFMQGHGPDPEYQIRPIRVDVSAGMATIAFRRELVVLEDFNEWLVPPANPNADYTDDTNFEAAVEVWRVFNDPRTQVSFLWEPMGVCGCGTSGCSNCAYATQTGCLIARNPRLSLLVAQPAAWNEATNVFDQQGWAVGRNPDIWRLFYYAGARDERLNCPRQSMPLKWEQVITAFAASKLDRAPCECSAGRWDHWAQDLAFATGTTELAVVNQSPEDLNNPFGTRRGAVHAWRWVESMDERVGRSGVPV